jgi:hypothetical protein
MGPGKSCPMVSSRTPLVCAFVALVFVGISLVGCTPEEDAPSISPTASRQRMLEFVDETAEVLGPMGWREVSGATLQGCRLDGIDGVNYTYTRVGPARSDPDRDAALVEGFWNSKGYKTKLTRSSNNRDETLQLIALGDDVKSIRYSVGPVYSGLTVESVCIPGDRDKIIDSGDF